MQTIAGHALHDLRIERGVIAIEQARQECGLAEARPREPRHSSACLAGDLDDMPIGHGLNAQDDGRPAMPSLPIVPTSIDAPSACADDRDHPLIHEINVLDRRIGFIQDVPLRQLHGLQLGRKA